MVVRAHRYEGGIRPQASATLAGSVTTTVSGIALRIRL